MIKFKYKDEAERLADGTTNNYQPNLNPERWDDDEEFQTPEEQKQEAEALDEFLTDMGTAYCVHCGGKTYTVEFGKRIPCPYGRKQVLVHSNKIVCYEADSRQ